MDIFEIITTASGILMIMVIIVQSRGADLGSGSGSELYSTRRGLDKSIYQLTITIATIFVVSIVAGIIVK
jgi:preprotein translocase subunit SecG